MSQGKILATFWVPGLPHVLQPQKSPRWEALHKAFQGAGEKIAARKPDLLVVYSTQWLSVLGTSFQCQPRPQGVHVDENWYELGDLPFDIRCDEAMGKRFAEKVGAIGIPTKTINYENFPIDTGTIVAMRYLNPRGEIPVSIVSSWVYADAEKSRATGEAMRDAIVASGKRAVVIVSSLLSTRYFTDEIDPKEDRVSNLSDDERNRQFLAQLESAPLGETLAAALEHQSQVPVDMQFNAYHWLTGIADRQAAGRVLAYGPQWGTGAAIIEFA